MAIPLIQTALSAGEISPELYGETSLAKYAAAATTLRNFVVNYRGGAFSRGGLALVGVSLQSTRLRLGTSTGPARPVPFQFSITQGIILEFGDEYIRFVFQGGYVVENSVAIGGISQSDPATVTVAGTPFADGDWVFISNVAGMTEVNGQTYVVADVAAGSFTLQDLNGNPINSTGFAAYAGGGELSRLYTVATPYAAIDLPYLKFSQSADVMSLTCSNPVTQTEYPPYDLTRLSAIDWALVETDFDAVIQPPAVVSAQANALAPSAGVNASFAYQVTAVDALGNESVASETATCHGADLLVEAGTNTVSWFGVQKAKYFNVYRAPPSVDTGTTQIPVPAGSIFGFVGSSFGTQFSDNESTVDLTQTPPTHQNPFAPGQILSVNILTSGSGLTTVTYVLTSAHGTNFTGYPVVLGGSLGAFVVTDNGEFFAPGDSIAFDGAGFASGSIDFTTNPNPGDMISLGGVNWFFETAITGPDQTIIQGALAATLGQLVTDLSTNSNPVLGEATYSVDSSGKNLLVNYKTPGPSGNAFTLAASAATPSGPTLTGGSGTGGTAPTATLNIGPTSGTYPGVNAYFQQRRFYANSFNNPDTFWASRTALYQNFDTSIPSVATDAITASPWTEQVNGIQWLVPMPGGLIAMTGSRAWQIVGEGSYALNVQPITPSTTQAQPQAFNGCSATVQPIVIDYDVIYVEAVGNTTVRDLSYNFFTSIYTGADLTLLSSHLFLYQQIVYTAWSRKPYKVLWCCRDDGTMLSMTYLKEQEVYGWARHDTLGLVLGIASITEPPVNAIYCIVQRFPPYAPFGIYTMERMDNRIWQSVEDAYAVDSGVSNPMAAPELSLFASSLTGAVVFRASGAYFDATSVGRVIRMGGGIATVTALVSSTQVQATWILAAAAGATGLPYAPPGAWSIAAIVDTLSAPHLAGMTLVGLADGVPVSGLPAAADGTVTLPFPASDVKVGLPFLPQLQTPYLNGNGVTQGARKVIPAVTLRVAASGPFQYGTNQPDGSAMNPPQLGPAWSELTAADPLKPTGGQSAPPSYQLPGGQTVTQLWTGDLRVVGAGAEWNSKGQVAVQQLLPLALELTAIMPEILDGDVPERGYSPQQAQGGMPQQSRPPGPWMIGKGNPRI